MNMTAKPHPVTILVVDDEPCVRRLIQRMLASVGYSVLGAANAQRAMVVAERHACEIDLLVTDVMLPDINGFDLAYCLGGIMKVLFVTGHAEDDPGVRTGLRGTSFLLKPFRADELQRRVRRMLDRSRPDRCNRGTSRMISSRPSGQTTSRPAHAPLRAIIGQ